jgi:hypothetical protein
MYRPETNRLIHRRFVEAGRVAYTSHSSQGRDVGSGGMPTDDPVSSARDIDSVVQNSNVGDRHLVHGQGTSLV